MLIGEQAIKIKILSKEGCEIITLSPLCTMQQLKEKLADKAHIHLDSVVITKGYFKSREPVDFSKADAKISECNIISGDIFYVDEKPPGEIHREDVPRQEVVNTESLGENPGMLMKKVVPGDNSCLFTSIGFVINGKVDPACADYMRSIVASEIAQNPDEFSEAILGRPSAEYCKWIQQSDSWGGAIELSILSKYYGMEIVVVDSINAIINRFGEDHQYPLRVFLMFDGIHFDPLYLEREGQDNQTIFQAEDSRILQQAIELAKEANSSRQYTDVEKFTLKCQECDVMLSGQLAASHHAKETGHTSFGEVKMDDDADLREQLFHNTVRENIIFLLLFLLLYTSSYALIARFRRNDREDYLSVDEDEAMVYRISLWLCSVSLAVSIGATSLLPLSIASNEVLILYPNSYYVKWLNSSLIQGLWNHVFLFSNLSLFVFLPFAYLFTESEGFAGYKKGIMSRVYETVTVLCLLGMLVLGMTYIMSSLIDYQKSNLHTLLNLWSYYLPFLYSCVSFLGVVMLLLCTPVGFVQLFGVVGSFLVKPQFLKNLDEEFFAYSLEEDCIKRRLEHAKATGKSYVSPVPMSPPGCDMVAHDEEELLFPNPGLMSLRNGALQRGLTQRLVDIQKRRKLLDKQRRTWWVRRTLVYPLAMLALLVLSTTTALLAVQNTLQLLIGIKALPLSTRQFTLGISSLSKLGPIGAAIEVIVILYLAATSAIGLYSLPGIKRVRPRLHSTPFTHLIANCVLLLVLSSALPLLSRIIGMTNFDLLGDFGSIEWLGNFKLVLFYNLIFAIATIGCLTTKFSATVRKEIYARLRSSVVGIFRRDMRKSNSGMFSAKED